MTDTPEVLNRIVDKVLAYKPPLKPAKKQVQRKLHGGKPQELEKARQKGGHT